MPVPADCAIGILTKLSRLDFWRYGLPADASQFHAVAILANTASDIKWIN
jgi:hypothetical protein